MEMSYGVFYWRKLVFLGWKNDIPELFVAEKCPASSGSHPRSKSRGIPRLRWRRKWRQFPRLVTNSVWCAWEREPIRFGQERVFSKLNTRSVSLVAEHGQLEVEEVEYRPGEAPTDCHQQEDGNLVNEIVHVLHDAEIDQAGVGEVPGLALINPDDHVVDEHGSQWTEKLQSPPRKKLVFHARRNERSKRDVPLSTWATDSKNSLLPPDSAKHPLSAKKRVRIKKTAREDGLNEKNHNK